MKLKIALAASITAAVLSVSTSAYAHRPFSHGILAYGYAPTLIADPLIRSGFALAYQVPNLMIYNRYRDGLEQSYHYRWEFVNGAYQWVGYYFEEPWRHHAPRVYSSVPPPHFYHRGHRMPPPPHVGHRPPPPPPGMGHRPPPPPHGMGHRPPPPPPHGMGHKPPPPPPHGLGHKPPPHH